MTNSLRLRGYDVQTLSTPKTLSRQLIELAPRLVLPAVTLGVLIAVSVGWLLPREMSRDPEVIGRKAYRSFIDQKTPLVAGQPVPLNLSIVDQFGKPFTDFESNPFGQIVFVASRQSRSILPVGEYRVAEPCRRRGYG